MKALRVHGYGQDDHIVLDEVPVPEPRAGEVRVRVHACGISFVDLLLARGGYQVRPTPPFVPGSEFSGVVDAIGPDTTTDLKPGDRVAGTRQGAWAESVCVPATSVFALPADASFVEGAVLLAAFGTALYALRERGHLRPGETLLVLGATGSVGHAAVQIGKLLGARVIAAASTDEKLAVCKAHGADVLINYSTQDLRAAIKEATGGLGPDVIYDPVGGVYAEPAFRSIGWRGRYLVIGFANGEIPRLPANLMLLKGASMVGVFWGDFARREPQANAAAMRQMMGWIAEGKLRPLISARYSLADTAKAFNALAARQATGKIVIEPGRA